MNKRKATELHTLKRWILWYALLLLVSRPGVSDSFWPHVAHQAPLSMDFPGKNTGMGCHFLLQGIFPTQGLNTCLPLGRWILYHWTTWEAWFMLHEFYLIWKKEEKRNGGKESVAEIVRGADCLQGQGTLFPLPARSRLLGLVLSHGFQLEIPPIRIHLTLRETNTPKKTDGLVWVFTQSFLPNWRVRFLVPRGQELAWYEVFLECGVLGAEGRGWEAAWVVICDRWA